MMKPSEVNLKMEHSNLQQGMKIEKGTELWVKTPRHLLEEWGVPVEEWKLGWMEVIVLRVIHQNKGGEITVEIQTTAYQTPPGVTVQLTLTKSSAWEAKSHESGDNTSRDREVDALHSHNQLALPKWRPYPNLDNEKIQLITNQWDKGNSNADTDSLISFSTETTINVPDNLMLGKLLKDKGCKISSKELTDYLRRETNLRRLLQGTQALMDRECDQGLLLARVHEVHMRISRMNSSWQHILDILDEPNSILTKDLGLTEHLMVTGNDKNMDPVRSWTNIFKEMKAKYNDSNQATSDQKNYGIFLLNPATAIWEDEEDSNEAYWSSLELENQDTKLHKLERTKAWSEENTGKGQKQIPGGDYGGCNNRKKYSVVKRRKGHMFSSQRRYRMDGEKHNWKYRLCRE
jgi:hypothetical protein